MKNRIRELRKIEQDYAGRVVETSWRFTAINHCY